LEWRRGGARDGPDRLHADAWRHTVRAWCAAWWCEAGHAAADDPWERALAVAARGSLARRVRRSIALASARGSAPGLLERVRRAPAGTPSHRIHGGAAVLLLAAAQATDVPRLPAGALRALRRLGVTRADR